MEPRPTPVARPAARAERAPPVPLGTWLPGSRSGGELFWFDAAVCWAISSSVWGLMHHAFRPTLLPFWLRMGTTNASASPRGFKPGGVRRAKAALGHGGTRQRYLERSIIHNIGC